VEASIFCITDATQRDNQKFKPGGDALNAFLSRHSGRPRDTLRDLNFELGVDVVMVFFGTVDDDILVMMAVLHLQ
jgi:hypothetical protein